MACGLLGENGRKLTNCVRMVEEKNILKWKKGTMSKKVPSKVNNKAREDFIRWLRNKNVTIVKDFDSDCKWKWLIGEESKKLYVKVNREEYKACENR